MAWCRQATSHYLSQCWPISLSPYDVTRPQWVNGLMEVIRPLADILLTWILSSSEVQHFERYFLWCVFDKPHDSLPFLCVSGKPMRNLETKSGEFSNISLAYNTHTMDMLWEKFQWILPLYMKQICFQSKASVVCSVTAAVFIDFCLKKLYVFSQHIVKKTKWISEFRRTNPRNWNVDQLSMLITS